MTEHLSFPDLVKEMEGKDTLKDWDVLVSYDEEQINKLLASRTASMKELCTMEPIDTVYHDAMAEPEVDRPCKITLNLGAPTFKFIDSSKSVSLSFPASGTYQIETKSPKQLPKDLVLTIETSLVSVKGYLTNGNGEPSATEFIPNEGETGKSAKEAAIFEPGVESAAHAVCIDFSTSLQLRLSGGEQVHSTIIGAETQLLNRFKKHGLKYYIAGISNTYKSESNHLLKPKSFCFTIIPEKPDEGIKGTLCMWLAVEGGSGNEERQKSSEGLIFHPEKRVLHPIPKGRSASIIFSYALMANYIKAELEKKSFTKVETESTTGKSGLKMTARIDRTIEVPKFTESNSNVGGSDSMDIGALKFNLNETTIGITFRRFAEPSHNPPLTSVDINFSIQKTIHWEKYVFSSSEGGTYSDLETGDVEMDCSFGGTGHWEGPTDEEKLKNPNLLKLNITMDQAFTIRPRSVSQYKWWGSSRDHIPERLKKVGIAVPSMDLKLGSLDYFLTTNLILPGAHVFKADSPWSEAGCGHGLAMPRDVILTGTVAEAL